MAQACDCNRNRFWVRFPLEEITCLIFLFLLSIIEMKIATLCSGTQHYTSPEFGRKWEEDCLNTSLPPPTLVICGIQRENENKNKLKTNQTRLCAIFICTAVILYTFEKPFQRAEKSSTLAEAT